MPITLPRNPEVADQFDLLADLLELEGEEAFRVLAYRRAATRIRETGTSVAQMALDGQAKELPGIGRTIEGKIVEIVKKGEIEALTKRKARIPGEVVLFMRLPGLGPKTARKIWKDLGVTTLSDLREAAKSERIRALPGLGAKTEENIVSSLAQARPTERPRPLLGSGLPAVLAVVAELRSHPAAVRVSEAGSVRRRRETFRDLDIIATAQDAPALIKHFTTLPMVQKVVAKGGTKATVVSHDGLRFDLRVVPPESYGSLLQHFTGSKDHNVAMRERAVKEGLSLSEYAIKVVETGEELRFATEQEFYERLGYRWIPPELRENKGELEAARRGELPKLVELRELKGDLHTHTDWSADGHNSLEEMALAARDRGYAYYAVTDHSHYLREGRLERQWEEVDRVNARLKPFRILKGVEVNIRADGSLDMRDEELSQLDWVVASIHSVFHREPTERVQAAMENPNVDVIGHLTGRKINKRPGAPIDLERVIAKALETGCFLEINSQPDRLDLRDVDARLAGQAGVPIAVSSDAHQISAQNYVELGIGQARRAWLTRKQVLNTRSWAQIAKMKR